MYVNDRVTGSVSFRGVGVHGGIVEYPEGVGVCFLCDFCLLLSDGAKGGEHGWVDRN